MDLSAKIAILTGASRGLGALLAERLAAKGVNLALAARSASDLDATAARLPASVRTITVPTDVARLEDLENLVERTTSALGPPDILINNAAIEVMAEFETIDPRSIESIFATNVVGLVTLTRLVVPGMIERRHGHVANMASLAGKTAAPYLTVYAASKHAVVGFSLSLREELRRHGIGVSVVCPSFVTEAGMYAQRTDERPAGVATSVPASAVVDRTIRAIERNEAEAIVAKGLSKVGDVFTAIHPDMASWVPRRSGTYDWMRELSRRTRAR